MKALSRYLHHKGSFILIVIRITEYRVKIDWLSYDINNAMCPSGKHRIQSIIIIKIPIGSIISNATSIDWIRTSGIKGRLDCSKRQCSIIWQHTKDPIERTT